MQPVLSREQVRSFDRRAIDSGVPGLVLMENAGRSAAEVALDLLEQKGAGPGRVLVVCGGGNNGGDGYVVARVLRARGVLVEVLSPVSLDDLRGDALTQARAWLAVQSSRSPAGGEVALGTTSDGAADSGALGQALARADLVVDALLGTGASRNVEGALEAWIEAVNASRAPVLALDVPSGLDADTGRVLGVALRAANTVTFGHYKRGLFTTSGQEHAGKLVLRDIGVPPDAFGWATAPGEGGGLPAAWLLEPSDVAAALSTRSPTAHKGSAGRVAVVAGSPGRIGAARLAVRGALRGGAGLVTIATRAEAALQIEFSAMEEMTARLVEDDPARTFADLGPHAFAVGPGLGLDAGAWRIVEAALARAEPVVLDADALHLLALRKVTDLGRGPRLLTPHPGEAARLLDTSAVEVESDRFGAARALVDRFGAVVVLKGPRTIIAAPGEVPRVSAWGSSVLATGGTGDVLTGLFGALLVGHTPFEAAWLGVAVHAVSGELCTRAGDAAGTCVDGLDRGVLAREVADGLPRAMAQLRAARI